MQGSKESRESFFGAEFRPKKKKILPKLRKMTLMSLIWKKAEKNSFLVYISDRKSDSYTGEKAQDVPFP
ncbi:hypothetical protein LEP1GSC133_1850 [Leptospira borgpetersenii serovar Pomona str. 200901868]|uniref:Uncharacterized protein n=1 Tax=Leptospira borgpetersenii serovar Pomona str. 200901868 TaxID=1192866 RepID=M6VY49_LEPBO|nr:hypothetical protein LEP1GSC133_1850 [Leptospira borgpetersenii serovar Pomona str. 200901868]